jgi:hypothetical protein
MKQGSCKLDLSIAKRTYKPGEILNLHCHVDNSENEKKIRQLKVKFVKMIRAIDYTTNATIQREFIIDKKKHKGIKAGEVEDRVYQIPIESKFSKKLK